MKEQNYEENNILVVDDDQYVLEAYGKILAPTASDSTMDGEKLKELQQSIFGIEPSEFPMADFNLDLCSQGDQAVHKVREARDNGKSYAVAFVDIVMPPGPDGVWTAQQIRRLDKEINIVIVTAYSDTPVEEIAEKVKPADKLFYLKKPFHASEIKQFALGLCSKFHAERDLNSIIADRTADLAMNNIALYDEIDKRNRTKRDLELTEQRLKRKDDELAGVSMVMETMFTQKKEIRQEFEDDIIFNLKEVLEPCLLKLKATPLDQTQEKLVHVLETNLFSLTSPFMRDLSQRYFRLTPNELQIARLIIQGKSSVQICQMMKLSKRTIDFHRDKLRQKLGIKNTKVNLKEKLMELQSQIKP